jgi:hypothetical protein
MKPKTRKLGETRAVYRVRTARTHAPKPRARVAPSVPWELRVAPTHAQLMEWHLWLNERADDLEEKYPGQFLAIWDKQVVASGNTRRQVYARADRARPRVIPLVTYIPLANEIAFAPSNFPIEWRVLADAEDNE